MFDAAELAAMRTAQEAHMMDTCYLNSYSGSPDAYGQMIASYELSTTGSYCGLQMRSGDERRGPNETVIEYDAILRLPITAVVNEKDRIKITKRFDETATAIDYEIVSPVQRGHSGIRVLLRKIET